METAGELLHAPGLAERPSAAKKMTYTSSEVAVLMGSERQKVVKLAKAGLLPTLPRLGKDNFLFPKAAIDNLLANGETKREPTPQSKATRRRPMTRSGADLKKLMAGVPLDVLRKLAPRA